MSTEHDKVEHTLPNGDILIVDSTRRDPEVDRVFDHLKRDLAEEAKEAYRRLSESRAAEGCSFTDEGFAPDTEMPTERTEPNARHTLDEEDWSA